MAIWSFVRPRFRILTLILLVACSAIVFAMVKRFSGSETTLQLRVLLEDRNAVRRWDAEKALVADSPGDPRTLAGLISALDDPNAVVRETAARALGGWGRNAAAAIPRLIRSLEDASPAVRRTAATTSSQLIILSNERREPAIHALTELLGDNQARYAAATALVRLGEMKSAIGTLANALEDRDDSIRWEALNSLQFERIGWEARRTIPALRKIVDARTGSFHERLRAGEVLTRLGEPQMMIQLLHEGRTHRDPVIRRMCDDGLKRMDLPPPQEGRPSDNELPQAGRSGPDAGR